MSGFRRPFEVVDYKALMRAHAPPPEYFDGDYLAAPDAIEKRQLERLQQRARSTYEVPFFRRRWDEAGLAPSDLRSLEDLSNFPAYLTSIERLVDFISDKPVVNVLGTHIEMTNTPFEDFPFGSTVHIDEHPLELGREHLLELMDGVLAMADAPFIEAHREFIIWPF